MANNFPGVYVSLTDRSAVPTSTSRFRCGLVGTANKGPINTPTNIGSVREFQSTFGSRVAGSYLANAVANLAPHCDGAYVVRIATEYEEIGASKILLNGPYEWSQEGGFLFISGVDHPFQPNETNIWIRVYNGNVPVGDFNATASPGGLSYAIEGTGDGSGTNLTFYYLYEIHDSDLASKVEVGDYVKIFQPGYESTVGLQVVSIDYSSGRIKFIREPGATESEVQGSVESGAVQISVGYNAARIYSSQYENSASPAEAILTSSVWDTEIATFTAAGKVNGYELQLTPANPSDDIYAALTGANISAGSTIIRISQTGKSTTYEALVKSYDRSGKLTLQSTARGDIGFQPVSLSDTYTAAKISVRKGQSNSVHLVASSTGTWANSGSNSGLSCVVLPGSNPETKRLRVYDSGILVDDFDNLSIDQTSTNYWTTRINGYASSVTVANSPTAQPSNTMTPWSKNVATVNSPAFTKGASGTNVDVDHFIGDIDDADNPTGLQAFTFTNEIPALNVIACPGRSEIAIAQELTRVARLIHALAIFDCPSGISLRDATVWHNSLLESSEAASYTKIDSFSLAFYWNWIQITDPFSNASVYVPPSVSVLKRMAINFDTYSPWFAHAGETRGVIDEATGVQFKRVSPDALEASYGNGNCINPVLYYQGRYLIWGNRTAQRTETKLSAINNVFLINECLRRLAEIGHTFVFDPNDETLLNQIDMAFRAELNSIKNNRGMESFELVIDSSNNNATTRNLRSVVVEFSVVPTDSAERLYINATVDSTGASATSVA